MTARGRARAEAVAILGRAAVEESLVDFEESVRTFMARGEEVRAAASRIRGYLPRDPDGARSFAESLPRPVLLALAAAWAGDAGRAALSRLGVTEQ